jgi:hypothetical protein
MHAILSQSKAERKYHQKTFQDGSLENIPRQTEVIPLVGRDLSVPWFTRTPSSGSRMHFGRRKIFTEFIQLFCKSPAFALAESARRRPVTFLDPHAIDIQSGDKEGQHASCQSVDLIHVIDRPKGETR